MFKKFIWPIIGLVALAVGILIFVSYPGIFRRVSENCPISWKTYRNEVLGIEFCYSPSWGDPQTGPIKSLTKLAGAVDKYSQNEQNGSSNRISISFTNNKSIGLEFFNNKYKGEYYPNSGAIQYGNTDNFAQLKSTANICDYKIKFNTDFYGKLATIWDSCQDKIKIALVQDKTDYNNQILYDYTLAGRYFQKTQNGYFDNLLMTFSFGYVRQRSNPITSLKDIFKGNLLEKPDNSKVSEAQYNQEKNDFAIFAHSVKNFKPVLKVTMAFKADSGEESDITTIRHYYYYLSNGQLQNAYNMYLAPQLDLAKYTDQYKNVFKSEPRDFVKKTDHEYEFYIDYQENNTDPTVYNVIMKINGDKIETILSEEITSPIVKSGPYTSFVKRVNNKNYMVLSEDGQETIIDEGETFNENDSNIGVSKYFSSPEFSSSNKYLFYETSGWEFTEGNVYDIQNNKVMIHTGEFVGDHGFTENEKYFFNCSSPGFSSGQGVVWSLADGKTVFDIAKDSSNYTDINCQNKKGDNFISFILSNYYAQKDQVTQPYKTIKFSF